MQDKHGRIANQWESFIWSQYLQHCKPFLPRRQTSASDALITAFDKYGTIASDEPQDAFAVGISTPGLVIVSRQLQNLYLVSSIGTIPCFQFHGQERTTKRPSCCRVWRCLREGGLLQRWRSMDNWKEFRWLQSTIPTFLCMQTKPMQEPLYLAFMGAQKTSGTFQRCPFQPKHSIGVMHLRCHRSAWKGSSIHGLIWPHLSSTRIKAIFIWLS